MTDSTIPNNSPILLYHDASSTYLTTFTSGGRFECHHGLVRFPEALEWGTVLKTNRGNPLAVLRPNHADMMSKVKRATTVVYPKEAGKILMELGVKNGGLYAEVGSGSGAMTCLIASMIGPEGKMYSFERNIDHLDRAKKNVERMGLSDRVVFTHGDPTQSGFGVTELDGLFVDTPAPWLMVPAGTEALAGGAAWVSLSPTIDQIMHTERALFDAKFVLRRMIECLEREWRLFPGRIRPNDRMVGHTAFLLAARKLVGDDIQMWRESKR